MKIINSFFNLSFLYFNHNFKIKQLLHLMKGSSRGFPFNFSYLKPNTFKLKQSNSVCWP